MNAEVKGLKNDLKGLTEIAHIQSNSIIELKLKSENLHESIKNLAHTDKNTQIAIKMMADESDKRIETLKGRVNSLEIENIRKEAVKSSWRVWFDRLPAIGSIVLIFLVILNAIDMEMIRKLLTAVGK